MAWGTPSSERLSIVETHTVLIARTASSHSYGQVVSGADLVDASITRHDDRRASTLAMTYFGDRLEKGVLRRVRSRATLVPRARDELLAAKFLENSAAASPPLVT
jgi:hypothetical protein